jgi:hypothetical protein
VLLVTVPLLLLCAVQLCALYACILLPLLLFIADKPFSITGSCSACAAGMVEYSWLRTVNAHAVLGSFILCDHAVFWR